MMNLPDSLFPDFENSECAFTNGGATANGVRALDLSLASVDELLQLLGEPEHREKAISLLTRIKKQGSNKDLALQIWRSPNTIFFLLTEIISIYKSFTPEKLTMKESSRVCDVLVLFECLASHRQTKKEFLNVQIHCYLYPFLMTEERGRPFQYLRLMSLGVIGGLLKEIDDPIAKDSVHHLLQSGFFPMCLRSIEFGNDLSQSTASWIISRLLIQKQGLQYCYEPTTRMCAIMRVFKDAIEKMHDKPSATVLKNIIQCYLIVSETSRGCLLIKSFIPSILMSAPYINALRAHPASIKNLLEIFQRLAKGHETTTD
ncbi:hypothetical protein DCAR_0522050 [Daucus carota subsp. sativus]|uniref:Cell differentiation protein rcd1 n=1 Tax=Daucus carota subsp. sativus TaxID=79200 RepID=A0AAF1B4A1_DAUCS|nr:PREDICTED: cell differentiation protein RCD1 homolog [Daucus carota subsp. sativus]WOH02661.1 hypothetical protein DCAR_0522050 [Daucus carota subsp. sativus]